MADHLFILQDKLPGLQKIENGRVFDPVGVAGKLVQIVSDIAVKGDEGGQFFLDVLGNQKTLAHIGEGRFFQVSRGLQLGFSGRFPQKLEFV